MPQLQPSTFYHIYNRGNNRQILFPQRRNYSYFLRKTARHLHPHLEILAYTLIPTEFHLLALSRPAIITANYSASLRILLSSYTRAIQNQSSLVGSLFQQNTWVRKLPDRDKAIECFIYIHRLPRERGLTQRSGEWPFSSPGYLSNDISITRWQYTSKILDLPAQPADVQRLTEATHLPVLRLWHREAHRA